jgi:8-oxo-dGTP diphosphatase
MTVFFGFFFSCSLFFVHSPVLIEGAAVRSEQSLSVQQKSLYVPPILTAGAVIEVYDGEDFLGIVLIERGKKPFGKALPGGKVNSGETVEETVRREMKEEVDLELFDLRQFHVYSDPARDPRFHSIEVSFLAKAYQLPRAGDDAAKAFVVAPDAIPWDELVFDHAQVLRDYLAYKKVSE